jgi:UDP-glucose 6-dehydrogenase
MHISVIGLGYVGLVTAACAADWENEVVGFDADPDRQAALRAGRVPFTSRVSTSSSPKASRRVASRSAATRRPRSAGPIS